MDDKENYRELLYIQLRAHSNRLGIALMQKQKLIDQRDHIYKDDYDMQIYLLNHIALWDAAVRVERRSIDVLLDRLDFA